MHSRSIPKRNQQLENLASVDIVFTPDKTQWTRCWSLKVSKDSLLAEGRAKQFELRKARSVNVDGDTGVVSTDPLYNSDYIAPTGMGWFPGYAINLETGERLNMMFGENSWLVADNGRDMILNPTSELSDPAGNPVFGGQHYIYVMSHRNLIETSDTIKLFIPAYDACQYIYDIITKSKTVPPVLYNNVYKPGSVICNVCRNSTCRRRTRHG